MLIALLNQNGISLCTSEGTTDLYEYTATISDYRDVLPYKFSPGEIRTRLPQLSAGERMTVITCTDI